MTSQVIYFEFTSLRHVSEAREALHGKWTWSIKNVKTTLSSSDSYSDTSRQDEEEYLASLCYNSQG